MTSTRLLQYEILDGNGNSEEFCNFIERIEEAIADENAATYQPIIILDNVAFHKTEQVRTTMAARGFEFAFLPPYSPFFNPIENLFSQWQNFVRSVNPNNQDELIQAIHGVNGVVLQEHCHNYCHMVQRNTLACVQGQVHFDN